jgi:hypothetical protein
MDGVVGLPGGAFGDQGTVSLLRELRLALGLEINTGRKRRALLSLPRGGYQLEEDELELLSAVTFKERVRSVSVFIISFF